MTEQPELFPTPRDFHPNAELAAPRVWLREVRVLRTFTPGDEIRRITLRPGLNILWARPRSRAQPARLRARGLSGHATGKTTFCRFVRHLLGLSPLSAAPGSALWHDSNFDGTLDPSHDELLAILASPETLTHTNVIDAAIFL